ncbi:hypothetical protein BGZ76_009502 [Entomortierella beljakovae]|nr:hypothetical protein BGZ76_009502 [Entomortierella beljakovae]
MSAQHQEKPEEVTIEEVRSLLQQENRPPLIDVRDSEEFVLGAIHTSHNIPLSELDDALAVLSDEDFKAKYNREEDLDWLLDKLKIWGILMCDITQDLGMSG